MHYKLGQNVLQIGVGQIRAIITNWGITDTTLTAEPNILLILQNQEKDLY